jgi:hypothetical protein
MYVSQEVGERGDGVLQRSADSRLATCGSATSDSLTHSVLCRKSDTS